MIRVPDVEGARERPNILFIYSDQHNARCLSCTGHPDVQTPNLDRLAAGGTRFENAYTQNPICTPARMSVLTGLYPSTHGYYGLYGREPERSLTSMHRYFLEHGYRTGALGKLHTPRYWLERHCQYVYDELLDFPMYLEGAGLYEQNDARAFHAHAKEGGASNLPLEHCPEWVMARMFRRFLHNEMEPADRARHEQPWLAWVCYSRPHQPYTPSEPYASMYSPGSVTLPPQSEGESDNIRAARANERYGPFDESTLRHNLAAYLGCVSQVDGAVGLLLEELERAGQLDKTVVVYSSDHGDHAGEHGMYEKKCGISARSITRIPLIIRYPGSVAVGRESTELAEAVDVFPTLCDLAGLPAPDSAQGSSLMPLLGEDPRPVRDSCLTENIHRKALATRRWRFVANEPEERDELYDVTEDPWELCNRIDDPDCAEVVADMRRRLLHRLARARRPVTAFRGGWLYHRYDGDGRLDVESLGQGSPYD